MKTIKQIIKRIVLTIISICLFLSIGHANLSSRYNIELGTSSYAFSSRYTISYNEDIKIYQHYLFKEISHPTARHTSYNYSLNNNTFINEEGYVRYKKNNTDIAFGRKYTAIGQGTLSGLLISPVTPSLDQLDIKYSNFGKNEQLNFSKLIVKLDNRNINISNIDLNVNRWFLLNKIEFQSKSKNIKIAFIDALISTGINRNLDWYYMLPLPNLILERKNQQIWSEGSDTTSAIGKGDNDNHILGINIYAKKSDITIFSEILFDEWQLSKNSKNNMQTVFGLLLGINIKKDKYQFGLECGLASPWLYLNRGLYSNLEYQGIALGLEAPHSMEIGLSLNYKIDKKNQFSLSLRNINKSFQNISTKWDAWNNYISPMKNINNHFFQFHLKIEKNKQKTKNIFHIYNDWLGQQGLKVLYEKQYMLE